MIDSPEQPRLGFFEQKVVKFGQFGCSISFHTNYDQSVQVVNAVFKLHQIELDPKTSERLEVPDVSWQLLHIVPEQIQHLQFSQINDGFNAWMRI